MGQVRKHVEKKLVPSLEEMLSSVEEDITVKEEDVRTEGTDLLGRNIASVQTLREIESHLRSALELAKAY